MKPLDSLYFGHISNGFKQLRGLVNSSTLGWAEQLRREVKKVWLIECPVYGVKTPSASTLSNLPLNCPLSLSHSISGWVSWCVWETGGGNPSLDQTTIPLPLACSASHSPLTLAAATRARSLWLRYRSSSAPESHESLLKYQKGGESHESGRTNSSLLVSADTQVLICRESRPMSGGINLLIEAQLWLA